MTQRLYYDDSYATEFTARVMGVEEHRVYLDQTAFYPTSGGQPYDLGTINGLAVVDVIDEEERVAHVIEGSLAAGAEVRGAVDWRRRWDHMQQHTGQHLLSAVLEQQFGLRTVSFHMGAEASTIDLEAGTVAPELLIEAERLANTAIQENRTLTVAYEDASDAAGLRKASARMGTLRIVSIDQLDRSACGGTHVRCTGEIGALLLGKTEKIRNTVRLEFVCGMRAVARARRDFDALSAAARSFSAPLTQVPALVAAQIERLADSEKNRAKLELALAAEAGRALYRATEPTSQGHRLAIEHVDAMTDAVRARAQAFAEGARAMCLVLCASGPSYLLAISTDSGLNAAEWLKPRLTELGGKGGGSAVLAQGRVASAEALWQLEAALRQAF